MNIVRNRLRRFASERFYIDYVRTPPTVYLVPEFFNNDAGIGVHDLCIERMPFSGAWKP